MKNEINIFKTKDIASFGGKDLTNNIKDAELAIADISEDLRIHNHSNTQFAWKRFVLSHKGGLRNIRQITAEINKKKLALHEAKHKYAKNKIKIESLRDQINNGKEKKYDRMMIEAEIIEIEETLEITIGPIEGAIKDILTLKNVYDEIIKKYPNYTEEDLEREEVAYWIRRLFSQALRDIRQTGSVNSGNQEAIEQMGFNVSFVISILTGYAQLEKESTDSTTSGLEEFLEWCVTEFGGQVIEYCGYGGFNGDIVERSLYSRQAG